MLFQKEMRLPIDSEVIPPQNLYSLNSENEVQEVIQVLLESRGKLFDKTSLNISESQREQKKVYDRKHQSTILSVNTMVLMENSCQKERKGGKTDDRYSGPYCINRHVGKGVYEVRNAHDKILKKKVNINRLKMYTCSKDIEGSSDDKAKGEHEEFNQEELLKQLHSPNLMRLWRTGASELLYSTEEDDYFDVSACAYV